MIGVDHRRRRARAAAADRMAPGLRDDRSRGLTPTRPKPWSTVGATAVEAERNQSHLVGRADRIPACAESEPSSIGPRRGERSARRSQSAEVKSRYPPASGAHRRHGSGDAMGQERSSPERRRFGYRTNSRARCLRGGRTAGLTTHLTSGVRAHPATPTPTDDARRRREVTDGRPTTRPRPAATAVLDAAHSATSRARSARSASTTSATGARSWTPSSSRCSRSSVPASS